MKTNFFRLYIFLIASLLIAGCGGPTTTSTDQQETALEEIEMSDTSSLDLVRVAKLTEVIINAIPSYDEIEGLMDEMGKEYQMELLNPIEHVSNYQLISDKAINLGIYLCDLGYISSFDQTQELIFYINCSKKLSEGIGVHEVVDEETLENLEMNIDNPDSLQSIMHQIYNQTYSFLDETNRLSTATLLVSGGWIEGLYIAMHLIDIKNPHLEMIENLIKQQVVYDQLMELIGNFKDDSAALSLARQLETLEPSFKKINAEGKNQLEALAELKEKISTIRATCISY